MIPLIDLILLLVIVGVIFYRLKSILGTRPEKNISEENAQKLFDLIIKEAEKSTNLAKNIIDTEATVVPEEELNETDKALAKIPLFNKDKFLNSAKKAFEMITSAFSKGDTETLEMLVNKNLLKKFEEIVEKRKKEGITNETDFIGFENAEITDAKLSKNIAKITVKFISEQVNILKNSKGEIIEGDENYIQNITDVWTFERNINSKQPNWLLASTKK